MNIAVNDLAVGNNLLFAEADMDIDLDYIQALKRYLLNLGLKWSFCWNRINFLNAKGEIDFTKEQEAGYTEGGVVYFDKLFYKKIGMANEFFETLGGMDNELIRRAEVYYPVSRMKYTLNHIYHKESKFKNDIHRDRNKELYYLVRQNPIYAMQILKSFKYNNEYPICREVSNAIFEQLKFM